MSQTDSLTFLGYNSIKVRKTSSSLVFLNSWTIGGVELTIVIDLRIKNGASLRDFVVTLEPVFLRKLVNKEAVPSKIREVN